MNKLRRCILLLFVMLLIQQANVFAEPYYDVVVDMKPGSTYMNVNGTKEEIDPGRGTAPEIKDGRVLVPIRAIVDAFGGNVIWDGYTETVTIRSGEDVLVLTINSNVALVNEEEYTLNVAPQIINERTMLPLRFVAEGLGLGVAWEDCTKTVTLIKNLLDSEEYEYITKNVPAYSGNPYAVVNNNIPMFKEYEIINASFEYYSRLDSLGRCNVCMASVAEDIMPDEDRESISSVIPSGWMNQTYEFINGKYLYNRCHLIGFQLTGENANSKNLITGTRYLNIDGMLDFENMVNDYIEESGNRVMYRVTPVFKGNNLVADGVLMEGYSVEDGGEGISFCVYCYNVQPGVAIDYESGESRESALTADYVQDSTENVYRTPYGKKYHKTEVCGGENSYMVTIDSALKEGLAPCGKCFDGE